MLIKKIDISNFGKLTETNISPDNGLNVIYAPNEGGKTTLLSFIRFIFYGSKQKKEYKDLTFKERYMPWNSMPMSGSCQIETDSGEYVIQRTENNSQSKLSVINLKNSNEEKHITDPGKEFFGLGEKAFSDSFFIKDLDKFSDLSDNGEIVSTLTNSYNEQNTYHKVKADLSEQLANISSTKRKSSEIETVNSKISMYENMLRTNETKLEKIKEKTCALHNIKEQYNKLSAEISELKNKKRTIISDSVKNEIDKLEDEKHHLEQEYHKTYPDTYLSESDKKLLIDDFEENIDAVEKKRKICLLNIVFGSIMTFLAIICSITAVKYNTVFYVFSIFSVLISILSFNKSTKSNKTVKELKQILLQKKKQQDTLKSRFNLNSKTDCILFVSSQNSGINTSDKHYINKQLEEIKEKTNKLKSLLNSEEMHGELSISDTIFFTNHKLDDIINDKEKVQSELYDQIVRLSYYKDEMSVIESDIANIRGELQFLNEEKSILSEKVKTIECSLDILEKAFLCVKESFIPALSERTIEIFRYIVSDEYNYLSFDEDFNIFFNKGGFIRNSKFLSTGTLDVLYFSLRIAIIEMINQNNKVFPVFIDDIFSNCDDARAEKIIEIIYSLSQKYQIFVCTCRKREIDFLKNKHNVNIISMQKG